MVDLLPQCILAIGGCSANVLTHPCRTALLNYNWVKGTPCFHTIINHFPLLFLDDCPIGFQPVLIGEEYTCYKFSTEAATWEDARAECLRSPGADLAIIENALENRYIANVAAGAGGDDWWIGKSGFGSGKGEWGILS